ncbi:hypothetical protein SmJEL517_g00446 [Synchytrium microbalum]|uniref:Cilia- and flagella-associated protein 58 central coiled coil domain-containing protein n=1 Tax=Synchytrium microbalum TaxID=1806994 RepID=A0A507CDM8_9FUNG|nr:uncharacterized protein SmJEL517_g00446 [Synchytrium microbalum]TPX37722.1 hypothetical protein SmJEL517_g00446 [Synchytrium microbalum]
MDARESQSEVRPAEAPEASNDDDGDLYVLFDLEASPIFKQLSEARSKGEVKGEVTETIKSQFRLLHNALLATADFEKSVKKKLKAVSQAVQAQRIQIDTSGSAQYTEASEVADLRRELLKVQHDEKIADDSHNRSSKEVADLTNHKKELLDEIEEARRHKADLLEPQLLASTKELKLELMQRRQQVETLQKDLEEKDGTLEAVEKEKERLAEEQERQVSALSKASEIPFRLQKQSEVLKDAISALVVESELDDIKLEVNADYEQRRSEIHEMERQCDEIFKDHEMAREQLAIQKQDRVRLDASLRNVVHQAKREHDLLLRAARDKDSQMKSCRRLEITLNNALEAVPVAKRAYDEVSRHLLAAKRESKSLKKNVTDLRREIDMGVHKYLENERIEKTEADLLVREMGAVRRTEEELEAVSEQFEAAQRKCEEIAVERDLKARELVHIRKKHRRCREDTRVAEDACTDAAKRAAEAAARLKEFATLYEVAKTERNKCLNQIQGSQQRAAEMKEKHKILVGEIEILRVEVGNKDRELAKKLQENATAYATRDGVRNEANKLLAQYRERRAEIDQHLSSIDSLNSLISVAETDLVRLRTSLATAGQARNDAATLLVSREDELCVLYEQLNTQAKILQDAEMELAEKDKEVTMYNLAIAELKRSIDVGRRASGKRKEIEDLYRQLEDELHAAKEESARLSQLVEGPENAGRCRNLNGGDPTMSEMVDRVRKLEERLATKEERLLEKDLVLEEVTMLTTRLRQQALDSRVAGSQGAMKLSDLTKKAKNTARAIMAKVSELAMQQAEAAALRQEVSDKEALLQSARDRLARGEPPTDELERDILRSERVKARREADARAIADRKRPEDGIEIDEDNFFLYNGTRTQAEPRPNAYIPDSSGVGELPLPKPYGSHSPFRPQVAGTQMRHFRKPVVKPIEI